MDNYDTPLHVAVMKNSLEITKLLVGNGADPNIRDKLGRTPLHMAILKTQLHKILEIVKLLIDNGAKSDIPNKTGDTPYDLARKTGEPKLIALFEQQKKKKISIKGKKCSTKSKLAKSVQHVCNPLTGTWIKKGGPTYNKLLKQWNHTELADYSKYILSITK